MVGWKYEMGVREIDGVEWLGILQQWEYHFLGLMRS